MHTLLVCLFITVLLPYLARIPVGLAMASLGYNNYNPRLQQQQLIGLGARAASAHQNSFESLLIFAIAVLTVLVTQKNSPFIEHLAILHVIARLAYHVIYLLNWATLRTLVWTVGFLAALTMLGICTFG